LWGTQGFIFAYLKISAVVSILIMVVIAAYFPGNRALFSLRESA
jgi:hypothetical protein